MSDLAGCVGSVRATSSAVEKVLLYTRSELDTEARYNRTTTSDAGCHPRSVGTTVGGMIRGTGFVNPSTIGGLFVLANAGQAPISMTATKYYVDSTPTSGQRLGYDCGTSLLFIIRFTGETNEAGMQEVEWELHSQAGITWSTSLT